MNTTLRALVGQAERLVRTEAYEEAIALCHAILRRHPRYARVYRTLAEAHLALGEHGAAADLFRRALGVDPEDPIGYAGLGLIFAERGLREEAIWQLERAFELAPGRDGLRRELSRLYTERGGDGQVQLTRAALARIYTRGGLWNKAIGELRDLVAREPYRLDLRVTLARTLWRAGQREEAARAAQAALDQAPNALVPCLILGAHWCAEGRTDEGQRLLLTAQELDPEGREASRLLGEAWPQLLQTGPVEAMATAEAEDGEAPVEPFTIRRPPLATDLPVWLEADEETLAADEHIATQPGASVQALLGSLRASADAEDDLPPEPEAGEVPADAAEAVPPLFGPDAPSTLLSPLALWQRRLDEAPDDHNARLGLARALVENGQLVESLPHYDILAVQPGYLDKVVADLEALTQAHPGERALRERLGDAYARAGRFQDALRMYHWLLARDDANDDAVGG
jgi:tetratricopeptide (TPR) repeat protein